jgi:hypothetical protein
MCGDMGMDMISGWLLRRDSGGMLLSLSLCLYVCVCDLVHLEACMIR